MTAPSHRSCKIMGVVNVTPDSFSDGGLYLDPQRAIARVHALIEAGADVIDLGPASSHPDAPRVPAALEIERLDPVLRATRDLGVPISVDSEEADTQRHALAAGATWINDIGGFADPGVYPDLAKSAATLVLMHRAPRDEPLRIEDALDRIEAFFERRLEHLEAAGIEADRVILDPGMGLFLSADPVVSLTVLRGLPRVRCHLGRPLLVGASRKSFLGEITGRAVDERGPATLAVELFAALRAGADYIRTHDVRALRDALRVWSALEDDAAPGLAED